MLTDTTTKPHPNILISYQIRDALKSKEVEMSLRSMPKMGISFFIRKDSLQKVTFITDEFSLTSDEDFDEDNYCEIDETVYNRLVKLVANAIQSNRQDLNHKTITFKWEYEMETQTFVSTALEYQKEIHYSRLS